MRRDQLTTLIHHLIVPQNSFKYAQGRQAGRQVAGRQAGRQVMSTIRHTNLYNKPKQDLTTKSTKHAIFHQKMNISFHIAHRPSLVHRLPYAVASRHHNNALHACHLESVMSKTDRTNVRQLE